MLGFNPTLLSSSLVLLNNEITFQKFNTMIRFFTLTLLALIFGITTSDAQTYSTGFDSAAEQAGWTAYVKGAQNGLYHWDITNNGHSNPNCLSHYYPVGGTEPTDDWYVSPVFDFSGGGRIDSLWQYFSGFGLPLEGDTIKLYLLTGSPDPDLASSKVSLYSFSDSNYVNDNTWRRVENIHIPATAGDSYLAFRYRTVVNWLDVRFDDIYVTAAAPSNTTQLTHNTLSLFPNPASNSIELKLTKELDIQQLNIVDMNGRCVKQLKQIQPQLDISALSKGSYYLQLICTEGVLTKPFMVL